MPEEGAVVEVIDIPPMTPEQYQARIAELETSLSAVTEQLATADQLLAEFDAINNVAPTPTDYKLANSNPAQTLFMSELVRPAFEKWILPIAVANLDTFRDGNGQNKTTGQDSMIFTGPGGRIQANVVFNYWSGKQGTKGATKEVGPELLTVSPAEVIAIDRAIATAKEHKDFEVSVKLATIKVLLGQQHGKLAFEDMVIVKGLKK